MAVQVNVPRLGWSMDEGTLVEWFKREGEFVRKGDMLFSLEGDKATQEIESFDEGYLKLLPESPKPGDAVQVGQVLAVLLAEGESLEDSGTISEVPSESRDEPSTSVVASTIERPLPRSSEKKGARTASPRARRTAERLNVDWRNVSGSGRHGRVRERDVMAFAVDHGSHASASGSAVIATSDLAGELRPITPLRRMIASRMSAAARQAAPVTLTTKVDASSLVEHREQLKSTATSRSASPPSYTDMMVKIVATLLYEHPMMLAQWRDDGIFVPSDVNICVAVDTDAGLTVPVVRDAGSLALSEIAKQTRVLIEAARNRRLTPEQAQGGTFTITNLGGFGIDAFTPIIQLPQSVVLGMGRIAPELALVENGIVTRQMMWLSLTFDHRVHDGAPAARFLAAIRERIESSPLVIE